MLLPDEPTLTSRRCVSHFASESQLGPSDQLICDQFARSNSLHHQAVSDTLQHRYNIPNGPARRDEKVTTTSCDSFATTTGRRSHRRLHRKQESPAFLLGVPVALSDHARNSEGAPEWSRSTRKAPSCPPHPTCLTETWHAATATRSTATTPKGAHFYNVTSNTLESMVGLIHRKQVRFTLPPRLQPMLDRATVNGHSLHTFCEELTREVLAMGRACAVLTYPEFGATVTTPPDIAFFAASEILDWKEELVDGRMKLTYLRLREDDDELDNGVELHLTYHLEPELVMRRWHVRNVSNGMESKAEAIQVGEDIHPTVRGQYQFFIPAVIFGSRNLSPDVERPPLLDLADANIGHFALSADYNHSLHMSALPTLVVKGALNEEQKPKAVGPGTAIYLPEKGDAYWLNAGTDAHESLRLALQDMEARMSALGAQMILSGQQRRQETAEHASMRYSHETAMLLSVVNQLEAGVRTLLSWARDYVHDPSEVVLVEFNRDLVSTTITPQLVTSLLAAVNAGAISRQSFIDALRKGEVIERTVEEELDLIEEEGADGILPFPVAR